MLRSDSAATTGLSGLFLFTCFLLILFFSPDSFVIFLLHFCLMRQHPQRFPIKDTCQYSYHYSSPHILPLSVHSFVRYVLLLHLHPPPPLSPSLSVHLFSYYLYPYSDCASPPLLSLSPSPSKFSSIYLSFYLFIHSLVYPCLSLAFSLSLHSPFIYLFIYLSIYLSVSISYVCSLDFSLSLSLSLSLSFSLSLSLFLSLSLSLSVSLSLSFCLFPLSSLSHSLYVPLSLRRWTEITRVLSHLEKCEKVWRS